MNFVSTTELKRSLSKNRQRSRRFKQELKDEGVEEDVDLGDIPKPKNHVGLGIKAGQPRCIEKPGPLGNYGG